MVNGESMKMNKIEKLIAVLCPEGVEWKAIGDFGELVRGNGMPKSDFVESGVGCIHYGQIYTYYNIWTTETISFIPTSKAEKLAKVEPGDLVITNTSENIEDVCKAVAWIGKDQIVTGGHATVLKHDQDPKYLSYYLKTPYFSEDKKKYATGTKVIDVSAKSLAKIRIPIPPLAIQQEIVKILDTFTTLEAKLEAELEARKKQYEYYRDELLTFGEDVDWKTLGDVCEMKAGKSISASDISSLRSEDNLYSCIGGNGSRGYVNSFSHNGKFPIIGRQGALCGNVCFAEGKFYATEHAVVVKCGEDFIARFLYHLLLVLNLNQYATGGAQPGLAVSNLAKIKIPIPPLAEQERIVAILDKFDALVNGTTPSPDGATPPKEGNNPALTGTHPQEGNLSASLPAELHARRKQYEYYRGKLLTFKEKYES